MKLYKPDEATLLLYNVKTGRLGLSGARVRLLCKQGRLGQRVGRGWVISQQDIDTFNSAKRPKGRPKANS